ncbi:hypothetical protein [Microcoleus sp.]
MKYNTPNKFGVDTCRYMKDTQYWAIEAIDFRRKHSPRSIN